ncbi:MAG: SseB family protein [Actinobacteria bacterium]|nr:SseB family protein [Actinomycetota bacterium]
MAIKKLPSTGDAPRSTGVPASLVAGGAADSAGFPWRGRNFDHHETAFAGDDGATPEALRLAVARLRESAKQYRKGSAPSPEARDALAAAHSDALLALSASRVLIPLLAEAGDLGVTPEGRTVEKTQELSIVTVAAPDGRRVMPVFSGVAAMRAWNAEARPIPVPMPQAALAAAQEQTDLIIVDPGTPLAELGVRRTQLEAVALGAVALPAWADAEVITAFRVSASDDPRVRGVEIAPADPEARLLEAEVAVMVSLRPGLEQHELTALLTELQQRWAASEVIAGRVDSLKLVLR